LRRKEYEMANNKPTVTVSGDIVGALWFIGWLFTVAYANLALLQALLALVIWPYYLGSAIG
jgi:hypothetical protein